MLQAAGLCTKSLHLYFLYVISLKEKYFASPCAGEQSMNKDDARDLFNYDFSLVCF